MKKIISVFLLAILVVTLAIPALATENPAGSDSAEDLMKFVGCFLDRRTETLVNSLDDSKSADIATNSGIMLSAMDGNTISESKQTFSNEKNVLTELDARREVLSQYNKAYSNYESEYSLINFSVKDDLATLIVEEFTKLYYVKVFGDEPDYTAWVVEREFIFRQGMEGWVLQSQRLINENAILPPNEATGVATIDMLQAVDQAVHVPATVSERDEELRAMTQISPLYTSGTLNRTAVVDYALKYWKDYNPDYRSWSADCTNFVSQAMRAGGWPDESGLYLNAKAWWYNLANQSRSWINVSFFNDFTLDYSGRGVELSDPIGLLTGEVLQVDFEDDNEKDHSMIVTSRGTGDIYLTYHSNDTLNRSYLEICSLYPNALWIPIALKSSF